ncbi:MAG: beta-ketoacyl synthase N-terminal-like domain-containing protein, partial [Bradymonadaceae bacterium]
MLDVLCEKTGYDPAEIEYDFELEADLGVDTVKQAEILADVRDKWGLAKDEDFRFSEYPTLERLADYVEERFDEGAFAEDGGQTAEDGRTNAATDAKETSASSVNADRRTAARETRGPESVDIEGDDTWKVAGGRAKDRDEIERHDIPASVSISGSALGLPGLDDVFDEEAVERLLEGDNFISQLPEEVRESIVDKSITRLQKHDDGGGELVEVSDVEEVIQLAARSGDFDLGEEWDVPTRLTEALDKTSQLAFAAGLEALRDAGLPLVPQYRETTSGKKITDGWKLPDEVGDETGLIFATAFAGQDAFAEELESYYTDEDYEFNHRLLLRMLGIANSRFAEYVGARGPNTKINNACASTTTALGIAQDWIEQGRCERVVVLSADDATGENMMEWVGSGFLATGAASTEEDVEDAALPFDKRRDGMIVGMGAVGLVVEEDGLPEQRGVEPLADLMSTHFVNSAHHPTRLDVDHIAGQVGDMLGDVEEDFELDREEIAPNTVFVSHETYTPARGGSADAEISA